jgi:hypothetical protein
VEIIQFFENRIGGVRQLTVILEFHIVQAKDGLAIGKTFVLQDAAAMNAFQEDGVIIVQQVVHEVCAAAGSHDIGQLMREAFMSALTFVILNGCAILFQFGLRAAAIFETVQVDLYTCLVKGYEFVKKIKQSSMINGVGNVE